MLSSAYHALWSDETQYADVIAADAHLIEAINLLNAYRKRLRLADDLDEEETLIRVGGTKKANGCWALQEPEGEAQATA